MSAASRRKSWAETTDPCLGEYESVPRGLLLLKIAGDV